VVVNRDELIQQLWETLQTIPQQPGHPWRTPVLATISLTGVPSVRTIVLRSVRAESFTLIAHTDVRSPKVAELRANPDSEWLFYDPQSQVQLRLRGETRVVTSGPDLEAAWDTTPILLRPNYASITPPSSPLDAPPTGQSPDTTEGKQNFALLVAEIDQLDWLQLNRQGHERILFTRRDLSWTGTWITP